MRGGNQLEDPVGRCENVMAGGYPPAITLIPGHVTDYFNFARIPLSVALGRNAADAFASSGR